MQILSLIVLGYFAFHSYLLKIYDYQFLSYHTIYIIALQLYLAVRKQSGSYNLFKEITQKDQKQQIISQKQLPVCQICHKVKPSRYYHCRRCNICVYRMDHHCQWVSNCIGQYNAKPYLHFLLNLFIHNCILFFEIFVWNFFQIVSNQNRSVYLIALVLPVIFILYETQRLLQDYYHMVKGNQTLIESYKKVKGKNQSFVSSLSQFLGSSSKILWFIPIYLPLQNPSKSLNLLEKTISVSETQQQPDDLTYADQYIYGRDDQDEDPLIKQAKQE